MRQVTAQAFQLGTHRVKFKQLLAEFQFHLHEGGNDINDLASLFQVQSSGGNSFRDVLYQRNKPLEVTDHVAFDGFGLFVILLRIRFQRNVRGKIGFFLRKFADSYALKPLDYDLNGAIGHTNHTSDTRYRAYFKDVGRSSLLYLSGFLCYEHDQ